MFECEKCEKNFTSQNVLKRHTKSCEGKKTCWICEVCELNFTKRHALIGHKRIHTTKTPANKKQKSEVMQYRERRSRLHDCRYCGKVFETGQMLGGHTSSCLGNPDRLKKNEAISIANSKRIEKPESNRKRRLARLAHIESQKGQVIPAYNPKSIPIIETYGKLNGYNFQHAENGGEFRVPNLGYFLDGYDPITNVAIEIDEGHHFDSNGSLSQKDIQRQKEIEESLGCKFIRIKF